MAHWLHTRNGSSKDEARQFFTTKLLTNSFSFLLPLLAIDMIQDIRHLTFLYIYLHIVLLKKQACIEKKFLL